MLRFMRLPFILVAARKVAWRNPMSRCILFFGTVLLCNGSSAEGPTIRGVPFSRSYSLGDIGHVPRGSRMAFDRFGRLAVINETIYTVLNDSTWLDLVEKVGPERIPVANIVQAPDGRSYYGARGSWGYADSGPDGRLHPISLVPKNPPAWILTGAFHDIFPTKNGVYFASWNGVVYWDFAKRESLLFELPRIAHAFQVGQRVFISGFEPLRYIDLETQTIKSAAGTALDDSIVETSTTLDDTRSLVAVRDGRLLVYDGQTASLWLPTKDDRIKGHISALQQMVDGRIAIAVTGQGLLLFSPKGELLMALTTPQYHNITALANREAGVLWTETEDTIEKILYSSPLSAFGQRLGLPIAWPIIASWNDQLYVASEGKLYQAKIGNRGEATRFELCRHQPSGGAWALAASGERMLVGNGNALASVEPDGTYRAVRAGNFVHLVMYDENHCYLIGPEEIALVEWRNNRWEEAVPPIPGVPNPAIVHRVGDSVWMEMGGAGVARLWTSQGKLHIDQIRNETWTKSSWVNIGSIGELIVLSARDDEPRRFFDQQSGQWTTAPEVERLLNRSPYWIARVQQDANGVIWASHNEGLVRYAPVNGDYELDTSSFDLVNDRYPVVRILSKNQIWVSAARALYHVEENWIAPPTRPPKPVLVSLTVVQRNHELLRRREATASPWKFRYAENNLSFRFYSGTDAWRRAPVYEFRLSDSEPWTALDGSLLTTRGLREGAYHLQVRAADMLDSADATAHFRFEILPPWHRTWSAYLLFSAGFGIVVMGVARWTTYLERRRNRRLERVVTDRTRQLETTMTKLGEETRKAATLEERDRLANEIHDSVQQGLTGAILQLDATLKHPTIGQEIRSRLNVVRNMVSYARQEVQHAVWDMESPLLEGTNLGDALQNLTTFVDSDETVIDVTVSGGRRPLPRTVNHNLLRIAQEATNNAFRHARATHIQLRLTYTAENVILEIEDDGVGFHPNEVLQERVGHLGLRGIRARAKKLHGQVIIESAPGKGTLVRLIVPRTDLAGDSKHADTSLHEQDSHPAR